MCVCVCVYLSSFPLMCNQRTPVLCCVVLRCVVLWCAYAYLRCQEDQVSLKSENIELYKRIRTVRAGTRAGGGEGGYASSATPSKARARKGVGFHRGGGTDVENDAGDFGLDSLDKKYTNMYEETLGKYQVLSFISTQNILLFTLTLHFIYI